MTLSTPIDAAIDPAHLTEIQRRLDDIASDQNVRVLHAVESGSRAWGFPSADSDLDVRFIYIRPRDWYLQLIPGRDVIETPIDPLFDINGWDVAKALRLMLRSNAVLSEWLESPLIYRSDPSAVGILRGLADHILTAQRLRSHYLRLAERHWQDFIADRDAVIRKKYLYALRPALVLRHLRMHEVRPPISIDQLLVETNIAPTTRNLIEAFIAEKRAGDELGVGARVAEFDALIQAELESAHSSAGSPTVAATPEEIRAADEVFLKIIALP